MLEDGTRIITQSAVFRALDRPSRGTTRLINVPTFMDARNLQPFINGTHGQVMIQLLQACITVS